MPVPPYRWWFLWFMAVFCVASWSGALLEGQGPMGAWFILFIPGLTWLAITYPDDSRRA